jgi:hypothetical protein
MAEPETQVLPGARLVAWISFIFGTVVSVAYNVLFAFLPPVGAGPGWKPSVWAVVFSAGWPLALLLSVELLARTAQRRNWFAYVIRYGGMTVVAAFSAVISYQHIRAVLLDWHYPELSAAVGPFVIDGLMVLAGYAMIQGSLALIAKRAQAASGLVVPEPKPTDTGLAPPKGQPNLLADLADEATRQAHAVGSQEQRDWERDILGLGKPITVPLPQPREEAPVNGRRPVSAAAKTRTSRAAAGPTVEEIVAKVLADLGGSPEFTITKKKIQETYGVGSGKANDALKLAREAHEARKEEL